MLLLNLEQRSLTPESSTWLTSFFIIFSPLLPKPFPLQARICVYLSCNRNRQREKESLGKDTQRLRQRLMLCSPFHCLHHTNPLEEIQHGRMRLLILSQSNPQSNGGNVTMEACVLRKWWGCSPTRRRRRWGSRAPIPAGPQHRWAGPHMAPCRETSWTRKSRRIRRRYQSPASQLRKWGCTGACTGRLTSKLRNERRSCYVLTCSQWFRTCRLLDRSPGCTAAAVPETLWLSSGKWAPRRPARPSRSLKPLFPEWTTRNFYWEWK